MKADRSDHRSHSASASDPEALPHSSLYAHPISAETELWRYLKKRQLGGRKFRRHHRIGPYVLDFYCATERLAVELDGEADNQARERDEERNDYLRQKGIRIIQIENNKVFEQPEDVLQALFLYFRLRSTTGG